jgi:hypothetical protein
MDGKHAVKEMKRKPFLERQWKKDAKKGRTL